MGMKGVLRVLGKIGLIDNNRIKDWFLDEIELERDWLEEKRGIDTTAEEMLAIIQEHLKTAYPEPAIKALHDKQVWDEVVEIVDHRMFILERQFELSHERIKEVILSIKTDS